MTGPTLPIHQINISANGVDFVCLSQGEGPLVLLVHGFPDIPQSWSAQMNTLSSCGYQVVVPYLPGYLPSRIARDAAVDKASLVYYLAGLIEQLSPDDNLHYIGQDWGAIIGYGLSAARPELIKSAVLMAVPHPAVVKKYLLSPKHIHRSFHWWFFQQKNLPEEALLNDDMAFIDYLWSYWSSEGYRDDEHVRQVKRCLKQPGVLSTALAYYRAMFDNDPADQALSKIHTRLSDSIKIPTLALCGADDMRAELMREQANFFDGEYEYLEIPKAGHFLHREQSDRVNDILIQWLER